MHVVEFGKYKTALSLNPTALLTTAHTLVYPSTLFVVVFADLCLVMFQPKCCQILYYCVINCFQLILCGHLSMVVKFSCKASGGGAGL